MIDPPLIFEQIWSEGGGRLVGFILISQNSEGLLLLDMSIFYSINAEFGLENIPRTSKIHDSRCYNWSWYPRLEYYSYTLFSKTIYRILQNLKSSLERTFEFSRENFSILLWNNYTYTVLKVKSLCVINTKQYWIFLNANVVAHVHCEFLKTFQKCVSPILAPNNASSRIQYWNSLTAQGSEVPILELSLHLALYVGAYRILWKRCHEKKSMSIWSTQTRFWSVSAIFP